MTSPMKFNDSKFTISMVHSLVQHDQMKHVRIDRSFIKTGNIVRSYIPTKSQEADVLNKTPQKASFNLCTNKLGMPDIYSPA